jgi:hypothetical protein
MRRSTCWWVLAWGALLPSTAIGQSPNNGAVVSAASGIQAGVRTAPDGAGGAFFAWLDARFNGNRVYMQHLDASGTAQWAANGIPVSPANQPVLALDLVPDATGGAIVVWNDPRTGDNDVYAQRVDASGAFQWTANGVSIGGTGTQALVARTDGAGGVVVAWEDFRAGGGNLSLYAQRVNAAGIVQWTADGVALRAAVYAPLGLGPTMVPDGTGGAIVAWSDSRNENPLTGGDIYAQRVSGAGTAQWTTNGVALAVASFGQIVPVSSTDGAGGAIVAWRDDRSGLLSIYAQRVNAAGVTQWTANGISFESGVPQEMPAITDDGAGGAIVAWREHLGDYSIHLRRLSSAGAPLWGGGVVLSSGAQERSSPALLSEAGAVIVTWTMAIASGNRDLFGQRLDLTPEPLWPPEGVAISTAPGDQVAQAMATDGAGGVIVGWQDFRFGASSDIFAQRVSAAGLTGFGDYEAPRLRAVVDVPNDQGGRVQLTWDASPLDLPPRNQIESYWIWREAPPAMAAEAVRRGIAVTSWLEAGEPPRPGALRSRTTGTEQYFWEFIGSQPAGHFPSYSTVAPTTSDSTAGSNPRTAFLVQARAADGRWWDSNPDSGYSADNLAPAIPGPLTGEYQSGATTLHWDPSLESDLACYHLHRGADAGFVPGPGNLIAAPIGTGWVDAAGQPAFYKLSALDIHGNESGFAPLGPASTTDVSGSPRAELWLANPDPNPMVDQSLLRFAVPRDAPVALTILDLSGRRVRRLIDGVLPAGPHAARWDGRDGAGREAASGLYLVRLETEGTTRSSRLVKVR